MILLKSHVLPDRVMRHSGSRLVNAFSSVDHDAFVEQLADPDTDGIDILLLDNGIHNAAQILEDRHRAHDRTAKNLWFARFVQRGDSVFVNGESLPPLVLAQQRIGVLVELADILEDISAVQEEVDINILLATKLLPLRDSIFEQL